MNNNNWQIIDKEYIEQIQDKKRILHVPKGSMVLWDSRTFHHNQYGNEYSNEERMVQYICYFPKCHIANTDVIQKKRQKYFIERRTTSHWPAPIKVVGLQPNTYGNNDLLIDYNKLPNVDLNEFEDEIKKLL